MDIYELEVTDQGGFVGPSLLYEKAKTQTIKKLTLDLTVKPKSKMKVGT